jgi:hypothetical protein
MQLRLLLLPRLLLRCLCWHPAAAPCTLAWQLHSMLHQQLLVMTASTKATT